MNTLLEGENKSFFYRRILTVTIPVVIQNMLNIGLNLADTIMIGRLGELELAATGAANQVFGIFISVCFGFYSGTAVFVAQYYGVKDIKSIRKLIGFDTALGALIGLAFLSIAQLKAESIIHIFAKDEMVIAYGSRYLRIVSLSYILMAISFALSYNSRVVARMKVPRQGESGAAIATLIARGLELVALVIYIAGDKTHPFHAAFKELFVKDFGLYNRVVKTGLPVVLSESGWSIGLTLVFATYGIIGPSALAVIQVASLTSMIFQSVIFGFGNGASVAIGETLGIGKFELAKLYANKTIKIALVMIACMVAGIILMIKPISAIYNFSPETTELLGKVLVVFAFTLIPRMLSYIFQCGILRAGGDTLFCMVIELTSNLVIELAMAYTAVVFLKWPLQMCIALASLGNIFKMSAFIFRYKSGKWQKKVI